MILQDFKFSIQLANDLLQLRKHREVVFAAEKERLDLCSKWMDNPTQETMIVYHAACWQHKRAFDDLAPLEEAFLKQFLFEIAAVSDKALVDFISGPEA